MHIEVSSSGDIAWDCGYYRSEHKEPEGTIMSKGKYLATWKKVNNKWKVAAVSISSDIPVK